MFQMFIILKYFRLSVVIHRVTTYSKQMLENAENNVTSGLKIQTLKIILKQIVSLKYGNKFEK